MGINMTEEDEKLGRFFKRERVKNIAFLRKSYSLGEADAEDIFQDACIAMYRNVRGGKIETLNVSIGTYLTAICINLARKRLRDTKRYDPVRIIELMNYERPFTTDQERAMEELVKHLPAPCNSILWLYYYEEMSMAEIAQAINFSNANSVKTKKSQCISKLKAVYSNRIKAMMYGK